MKIALQLFAILLVSTSLALADEPAEKFPPLALHPDNPHCFLFRGKPAILVGSGEHYGSVLNLDFDYIRYLDAIAADHLDHTRLFAGTYHEPAGAFKHRRKHARAEAQSLSLPLEPHRRSRQPERRLQIRSDEIRPGLFRSPQGFSRPGRQAEDRRRGESLLPELRRLAVARSAR